VVKIHNKWIVPYLPLLPKIYEAQISVEHCNSIESIKYKRKYVNKAVTVVSFDEPDTNNDEVNQFQIG